MSTVGNNSGSVMFTVFVLLLRPLSIDIGNTARNRIEVLCSVLTDLSVPPTRVGSNSSGTGSRAGCAFCTVPVLVS